MCEAYKIGPLDSGLRSSSYVALGRLLNVCNFVTHFIELLLRSDRDNRRGACSTGLGTQ